MREESSTGCLYFIFLKVKWCIYPPEVMGIYLQRSFSLRPRTFLIALLITSSSSSSFLFLLVSVGFITFFLVFILTVTLNHYLEHLTKTQDFSSKCCCLDRERFFSILVIFINYFAIICNIISYFFQILYFRKEKHYLSPLHYCYIFMNDNKDRAFRQENIFFFQNKFIILQTPIFINFVLEE